MQKSEFVAKTKKNGKEYLENNLLDYLQLGFRRKKTFAKNAKFHNFCKNAFWELKRKDAELKIFFSRNMRNSLFFLWTECKILGENNISIQV